MEDEKKQEIYVCKICNKHNQDSADALTHYLDHGSSGLNAINSMIKDQRTGSLTSSHE